jgi:hypothetical protein
MNILVGANNFCHHHTPRAANLLVDIKALVVAAKAVNIVEAKAAYNIELD